MNIEKFIKAKKHFNAIAEEIPIHAIHPVVPPKFSYSQSLTLDHDGVKLSIFFTLYPFDSEVVRVMFHVDGLDPVAAEFVPKSIAQGIYRGMVESGFNAF